MLLAGRKCLCLLAVLASVQFSATAAHSENSSYRIVGIGNESCGAYLQWRSHMTALSTGKRGSHETATKGLYWASWMAGYITAYNRFGPGSQDVAKTTDAEGLSRWLDTYCEQHPLEQVAGAAERLVMTLNSGVTR